MSAWHGLVLAAAFMLTACDAERKDECDRFLAAMKPVLADSPDRASIDRVKAAIAALQLQDKPLREYAASTKATLAVLSGTLEVQASPSAPDGTDALVKEKLKEARGEQNDVARYCAQ